MRTNFRERQIMQRLLHDELFVGQLFDAVAEIFVHISSSASGRAICQEYRGHELKYSISPSFGLLRVRS
jgi:hypothetical protein